MRRWGITAVAVGLGVALAGPSWVAARGTQEPAREYKGPTGTGATKLVKNPLSCTAWFAKDSGGTKLTDPIYPATAVHNVWMFVEVKNAANQPLNFDAQAKVTGTHTVPQGTASQNILWLTNFEKGLNGINVSAKLKVDKHGATKWNPGGKIVFLPLDEVKSKWVPGGYTIAKPPIQMFIKMNAVAKVHIPNADDVSCAPQMFTIRYDGLP